MFIFRKDIIENGSDYIKSIYTHEYNRGLEDFEKFRGKRLRGFLEKNDKWGFNTYDGDITFKVDGGRLYIKGDRSREEGRLVVVFVLDYPPPKGMRKVFRELVEGLKIIMGDYLMWKGDVEKLMGGFPKVLKI